MIVASFPFTGWGLHLVQKEWRDTDEAYALLDLWERQRAKWR